MLLKAFLAVLISLRSRSLRFPRVRDVCLRDRVDCRLRRRRRFCFGFKLTATAAPPLPMPLTEAARLRVQHLVGFSSFSKTTGEFVEHNEAFLEGTSIIALQKNNFYRDQYIRGCLRCDAQPSPPFLPTSITDEYQRAHPFFG